MGDSNDYDFGRAGQIEYVEWESLKNEFVGSVLG